MHIIIIGGGRIGSSLAEGLASEGHDVVIIDPDEDACDKLSGLNATVIQGDGTELKTLIQAGLEKADVIASLTPKEETNLLICLIAKKIRKCKLVSRINHTEYEEDFKMLGVDMVIYPEHAAAKYMQELLMRPDVVDLAFLDRGDAAILEFIIKKGSAFTNTNASEVNMPKGSLIIAVYENGKMAIPDSNTTMKEGNKIMVIARNEVIDKVRKMFG